MATKSDGLSLSLRATGVCVASYRRMLHHLVGFCCPVRPGTAKMKMDKTSGRASHASEMCAKV